MYQNLMLFQSVLILDLDNIDVKFRNQVPKKSANKVVGTFSTTNASLIFVMMLLHIWIFGSGNSANQTVGKNKPITHQKPKSVGRILVFQKIIPAEGPTAEEQIANLQLLEPTENEQLTLITCWPASGPDKFSQRLVVIAEPTK